MSKKLPALFLATAVISTFAFEASSQEPLTGTRLNRGGTGTPRTVLRFEEPQQFGEIRNLLAKGALDEARSYAQIYVEQMEKGGFDLNSRYYARNALCVVYTYTGEHSVAEEECSQAISMNPGHWSAWNNRGTLRLLSGNYSGAEQDYRQALGKASKRNSVVSLLEHNLELVNDYQN